MGRRIVLLAGFVFFSAVVIVGVLLTRPGVKTTPISLLQQNRRELLGKKVQVTGTVTADFQSPDELGGFFIQEALPSSPGYSSGVFVVSDNGELGIGDRVLVQGIVELKRGVLRLVAAEGESSVTVKNLGPGSRLPPRDLPPLNRSMDWSRYESMLVRFPYDMVVTDTYSLAWKGEVTLAAENRLFAPTDFVDPNDSPAAGLTDAGASNVAQIRAAETDGRSRCVILEDGLAEENPLPIPWMQRDAEDEGLSLRLGSRVKQLEGVVTQVQGTPRVVPIKEPSISYAPRPDVPDLGAADLVVASFNLLNFFTTIDDGENEARGADDPEEFRRQRDKLVEAITMMQADIVGLMEIENNSAAEEALVEALNVRAGSQVFATVGLPAGFAEAPGSDNPIRVGIIYRLDRVQLARAAQIVSDNAFKNARPPLVQQFKIGGTDATLTVIVNHFKSKGSEGAAEADSDKHDGQGAFNASRRKQASALVRYVGRLRESGASNVLLLGDLNAYRQEDPIDTLRAAGFVDLLEKHSGETERHTHVYYGQAGCLDYAFASEDLAQRVTKAIPWHINSAEPRCLDYNLEFNPQHLYRPDPYRSSDHDPVLVGLVMTTPR